MPKEKERAEDQEKTATPVAVERKPETPEKLAGPQPAPETDTPAASGSKPPPSIERAADLLATGDDTSKTDRARAVGTMQHNVGNARVGRMLAAGTQRKTEVSSPEDESEKEAEHKANQVMRMSDPDAKQMSSGAMDKPEPATTGAGRPLSKAVRAFMEPRFGRSFENVRLHTGAEAQRQARGFGAKAFTRGADISFGPGSGPDDKALLAHELSHVAQNEDPGGAGATVMRAPGPLSAAEEASARRFTASHYEERSVRIIQIITGAGVDGIFGDISAQAVATFQTANGLAVDGKVGPNTLGQMIPNRVAAGRHEHAIQLVVDFHDLDVTSDTLSVHFDASLAVAGATAFGPGNLRIITLGPTAFTSEPTLLATINAQLATPAPVVAPVGPRPALLTRPQEVSAVSFNRAHFSDRRSVLAIQGHVGSNPDAIFGPDTVQRIADAQRVAGLVVDGKVGEATLELFVTQLIAAGRQDAAIRMIIDFFNFNEANLLDIFFDPTVAANASTDFRPNEPVRIRVGPSGLAQPFAGIVHTLAHEFEHVRRLRQGIVSRFTHEFLGEAIEVLSEGMPEEALENLAPGAPGFVGGFADDAGRALTNWNLMPAADQRQFRLRFIAVRRRVRARVAAGTPAQQALHAPLVAGFNAVVVPAP